MLYINIIFYTLINYQMRFSRNGNSCNKTKVGELKPWFDCSVAHTRIGFPTLISNEYRVRYNSK